MKVLTKIRRRVLLTIKAVKTEKTLSCYRRLADLNNRYSGDTKPEHERIIQLAKYEADEAIVDLHRFVKEYAKGMNVDFDQWRNAFDGMMKSEGL